MAAGPDGAVAWSAGKTAFVRTGKGEAKSLDVPSTVGGLAFAPKGLRLAVSHYNGVSLWFPNAQAAPDKLEWKGSHHEVAYSADGRFLVTAMQEPALHGWRREVFGEAALALKAGKLALGVQGRRVRLIAAD